MKSNIAHRKHIETRYKSVYYKPKDTEKLSVSTGKMSNEELTSEFTIHCNTEDTDYRLTLSREDAKRVVQFWSEYLINNPE